MCTAMQGVSEDDEPNRDKLLASSQCDAVEVRNERVGVRPCRGRRNRDNE